MIISERQIHYLMDCTQILLNRMVINNESPRLTGNVELLLDEIREQQSTKLKEVN